VIGAVTDVVDTGASSITHGGAQLPARALEARVVIDQVVKGATDEQRLRIKFVVPELPAGFGHVVASTYRMLFVKATTDGYQFASPYYPAIVAVPVALHGSTPLDRAAEAVAAVIDSNGTSLDEKVEAVRQLSTVRSPQATAVLRRLLTAQDHNVRLSGAIALVQADDAAAVAVVEEFLLRPNAGVGRDLTERARSALMTHLTSPGAVPSLTGLLQATDAETRRAAASGLRHTRSAAAIRPLRTALDDTDQEVRYLAVIGLAEITGDLTAAPSETVFRQDEAPYLAYWKQKRPRL
jgi:hypothetical protein